MGRAADAAAADFGPKARLLAEGGAGRPGGLKHDRSAVTARVAEDIARAAAAVDASFHADVEDLVARLTQHYMAFTREQAPHRGPWQPIAAPSF